MTSATLAIVETPSQYVSAGPRMLLRLEGLVMLLAAVIGYRALGGSWGFFAAAFLVPDLSMLGYLGGPKVGAFFYNAGHSLIGPALLAAVAMLTGPTAMLCAIIWVAHIGFDRALGYGLKYSTAFFDTHLGRVGAGQHGDGRI